MTLLASIFALGSIALLALIRSNTDLRIFIGSKLFSLSSSKSVYHESLDPQINSPCPRLKLKSFNQSLIRATDVEFKDSIILFVGDCSTCAIKRIRPWVNEFAGKHSPMIIVIVDGGNKDSEWLLNQFQGKIIVYRDVHKYSATVMNAVWTPRAYLIGADKKLKYAQPQIQDISSAVHHVSSMLGESKNATTSL